LVHRHTRDSLKSRKEVDMPEQPAKYEASSRRSMEFKLVAWPSRSHFSTTLLACLGLVAAGVLIVVSADSSSDRVIGWITVVFFGLAGVPLAWATRHWKPILKADEKQIALPRSGCEINWADVSRLRLWTQFLHWPIRKDWLSIDPSDDSRIRWRGRGWRLLGISQSSYGSQMSIDLESFATPTADEVIEGLRTNAPVPMVDEREGWMGRQKRSRKKAPQ
ncbi:MAG: STM3941 family protein, partial [Acidimicrobiia bacterium]